MPARELNRGPEPDEIVQMKPPEPAKEQETKIKNEGEIPQVSNVATKKAEDTASDMGFGQTPFLEQGVHRFADYKTACERAGKPQKCPDTYREGFTSATQLERMWDSTRNSTSWRLKEGHSASQALRDFLKGPTIADAEAAWVAEQLAQFCRKWGDAKFDLLCGSTGREDKAIPNSQRLQIRADMVMRPFIDRLEALAKGVDPASTASADEPAKPVVVAKVEQPAIKVKAEEEKEPVRAAEVAKQMGVERQDRETV